MEKGGELKEASADPMDKLDRSMRDKLRSLRSSRSRCCIYKIPKFIREVNVDHYQPFTISIGPVFYKNETLELETMQELKWNYLQSLLNNSKNAHQGNLLPFLNIVRQREQEIRECYQHEIGLSSEEFIETIVLDAAFIICFLVYDFPDTREEKYHIMSKDLFVLENQLPFFVLRDLFDAAYGHIYPPAVFIDLCRMFMLSFRSIVPGTGIACLDGSPTITEELLTAEHLLDFWRILCFNDVNLPGVRSQRNPLQQHEFPKTAKQLSAAGVTFKAGESENALKVKFTNGVLEIPTISLSASTDSNLRNMLYFEECHCREGKTFFLDYIVFLDKLINTVEDVQILMKAGILDNWLGSEEVVLDIFNRINNKTLLFVDNFYYANISRDVNAYSDKPMNQWKALLRTKYFNNPWAILSVIAAIILFILTLIQTITGFKK